MAQSPAAFSRPASASVAGLITAAAQIIGGKKTFQDGVRVKAGSASDVGMGFDGDDNTGFWSPTADTVNLVTGGTLRSQWTSTGALFHQGPLSIPTSTLLSLGAFTFYESPAGSLNFSGTLVGNGGITSSLGASVLTLNESFMKGARGAAKWSLNEAGGGTAQLYHTSSGVEVGSGSAFLYNASGLNGLLVSAAVGARMNYGGGTIGAGEFVTDQVAIRSTRGGTALDRGVIVGTTLARAAVSGSATIFSAGCGIGTSYDERFWVNKDGTIFIGGNANTFLADGGNTVAAQVSITTSSYFVSTNSSTAFYAAANGAFSSPGTARMWSEGQGANSGETAVRIGKFTAGAHAAARLVAFGDNVTAGSGDKAAIMGNGEFESFVAGSGIVLKSSGGFRWRMTVSDAGAPVFTGPL